MLNRISTMMKGSEEIPYTTFVSIAFVLFLLALIAVIFTTLMNFGADISTSEKNMQAIDAAHVVRNCLTKGGDSIPSSFFASIKKSSNLCFLCDMCSTRIGASIEYMEGPYKGTPYNIDYIPPELDPGLPGAKSSHYIYSSIDDGGKVYMSKITVFVY